MRTRSLRFAQAAVLALVVALPAAARGQYIDYYVDRAAFEAALQSRVTETFDAGAVTTPLLGLTTTNGAIVGGLFDDRVVRGAASTTWTFGTYPGGVNGFGATWDLFPGGFGQGIEFTIVRSGGTQVVPIELDITYPIGFFGFISPTPFTAVSYTGGTLQGANAETYTLDDLTYGVSAVPEPATITLLGAGLALLAVAASRRRTGG